MGAARLPSAATAATAAAATAVHRLTAGMARRYRPIGPALRRLLRPGSAPWEPPWAAIGAALAAAALAAAASLAVAAPSAAVAATPAAASLRAPDRAPVALMGLSLAMTPREVLAVLRPQALVLHQRRRPCPAAPAAGCPELIRARTAGGWLTVRFADSPPGAAGHAQGHARGHALAWRIRLTLRAAGATDPRQVRAAGATSRVPTRPARMLWCAGVPPGATCPPNRPRLRLIRRPDGTRVLSLSNPGLRDRLARESAAAMRSASAPARPARAPAG